MNIVESMRCEIPQGKSGDWEVKKFSVGEEQSEWTRIKEGSRYVTAGRYTGLYRRGQVIMSDTPAEIRDHLSPVREAKRLCLVNGLGLGCVVKGMLERLSAVDKLAVDKVTVIEKSVDVIDLVAPYFRDRYGHRFECINADAYEYRPPKGERYAVVWHDIWDYLCGDNLPEMARLHRKYGRRADWQGSWGKEAIQRHERRRMSYGRAV